MSMIVTGVLQSCAVYNLCNQYNCGVCSPREGNELNGPGLVCVKVNSRYKIACLFHYSSPQRGHEVVFI